MRKARIQLLGKRFRYATPPKTSTVPFQRRRLPTIRPGLPVVALGVALTGPFIGVKMPLTVIQMLLVNLIMDTFAALALAMSAC